MDRIYLNDDQFFVLPLPPSAFHSTLYGPVFRLDPGFMIQADASGEAYGGGAFAHGGQVYLLTPPFAGEWRSLGWSNHILSMEPCTLSSSSSLSFLLCRPTLWQPWPGVYRTQRSLILITFDA